MEKKISKKTLNKSFRNWYYGHLTCFSQEHMQTFGYLCAMLPIIEELYKTNETYKQIALSQLSEEELTKDFSDKDNKERGE